MGIDREEIKRSRTPLQTTLFLKLPSYCSSLGYKSQSWAFVVAVVCVDGEKKSGCVLSRGRSGQGGKRLGLGSTGQVAPARQG